MARWGLLVAVSVLFGLLCGCRNHATGDVAVARLVELHGSVSKELATRPQSWDEVAVGASFASGDAVRTLAGATARVVLVTGGGLQLRERTTVRFLRGGAVTRHVSVETGEAEVETGGSALSVETLVGMAKVEPGSRVRVASTSGRLTFDVLIGRAQFEAGADGGAGRVVEAGQRFLVSIGTARMERVESMPATPPDKALGDAAGPEVAEAKGDAPDSGGDAAEAKHGAAAEVMAEGGAEPVVADVHGQGVKVSPSRAVPLASLAEGTSPLADGSRLFVPSTATVDLSRGAELLTVLGGSDVDIGKANEPLIRVVSGRVLVKSRRPGKRISLPGGSIDLVAVGPGDIQAEVQVERQTTRVTSNHGELSLHGNVSTMTLGPGQSGTLDARGNAAVEALAVAVADVTIGAGESPVLHSPNGVAAVRIRSNDCPGDSLIQVTSGKIVRRTFAHAQDLASGLVRLAAGSHGYVVSCVGKDGVADVRGTIRVVADSGVARLVHSAATNVVDADGRNYHVLYQNLLPQVTFRWPGAPAAGAVTLHTDRSPVGERRFPVASGKAALPAGSLAEGTYRFWFDVDGHPDQRSADTSLVIAFDNAAPAAEVREPQDGQSLSPTVHVSGIATEGSSVSVSGAPVPLDAQSRFGGDVPGPSADDRAIAVRIAHPVHGIHYYLRRFATPADSKGSGVAGSGAGAR